jgi:hypothetical protein
MTTSLSLHYSGKKLINLLIIIDTLKSTTGLFLIGMIKILQKRAPSGVLARGQNGNVDYVGEYKGELEPALIKPVPPGGMSGGNDS